MTTSTPSNNSSGSGSSSTSNSIKCNNSNTNNDSNNNSNNSNRQSDSERTTSAAIAVVAGAAAAAATTTTLYNDQHSPSVTASVTANIGSTSTNRVMQADEDFNIRFVNLVRTHRCLYDKKVPEYRNRDNQEKAWALISTETCESVIHCKERWRNLRACLSRYIKQQSGSEPQHKPYYLTEHMAFLLPFLKSTRNSLDGNNSLASLYQFSQQHLHLQHQHQQQLQLQHQQHQQEHLYCNNNNNNNSLNTNNNNNIKNESMELKHSMSENDDEETIDAFDPAIAATLGLHRSVENAVAPGSPAHSETASASSLQNFIPDVQLAESGQDLIYDDATSTPMRSHHPHHHLNHHHQSAHSLNHHQQQQQQHQHQQSHFEPGSAKRIKTECEATTTTSSDVAYFGGLSVVEHTDMEFFRSILPDIAALTPQQRRKFKIGILELIDDVVERYPSQERYSGGSSSAGSATAPTGASAAAAGGSSSGSTSSRRQRHNSGRDWRK